MLDPLQGEIGEARRGERQTDGPGRPNHRNSLEGRAVLCRVTFARASKQRPAMLRNLVFQLWNAKRWFDGAWFLHRLAGSIDFEPVGKAGAGARKPGQGGKVRFGRLAGKSGGPP